jgi:hypothetical protein
MDWTLLPRINECEPFHKIPNGRWDVIKASQSSECTIGLTPALAFPPSLQLGFSKKSVVGVELDPISLHINLERANFSQLRPTREHYWKYPLRGIVPR